MKPARSQSPCAKGADLDRAPKRVDFTYDGSGGIASITRWADLAGMHEVATSRYEYDDQGRLTTLTHAQGTAAPLAAYASEYDPSGRITRFDSHDGEYVYRYDRTGQLTDVSLDGTDAKAYQYDGNRTTSGLSGNETTYTTDDGNQLIKNAHDGATYTYDYDAEGRTVATVLPTADGLKTAGEHNATCHVYGFHDLRRAVATSRAAGLSASTLQRLTRHKVFATTQRYINMAGQVDDAMGKLFMPDCLRPKPEEPGEDEG